MTEKSTFIHFSLQSQCDCLLPMSTLPFKSLWSLPVTDWTKLCHLSLKSCSLILNGDLLFSSSCEFLKIKIFLKENYHSVVLVSFLFTSVINLDHVLTANTKRISDGTVSIVAFSFFRPSFSPYWKISQSLLHSHPPPKGKINLPKSFWIH